MRRTRLFTWQFWTRSQSDFVCLFRRYTDHPKQIDNSVIDLVDMNLLIAHSEAEADDRMRRHPPCELGILCAISSGDHSVADVTDRIRSHHSVHRIRDHFGAT